MNTQALKAAPAYWASNDAGQSVPVIISLLFLDGAGKRVLPPVVEATINKTVDATSRAALATATVSDADTLDGTVGRWMARAITMPDVIVLLTCQSARCVERVMDWLRSNYLLSLVRAQQQ